MARREERKVCCVCGRRKSKTWQTAKGCNACGDNCREWLEANAVGLCPWHKAKVS